MHGVGKGGTSAGESHGDPGVGEETSAGERHGVLGVGEEGIEEGVGARGGFSGCVVGLGGTGVGEGHGVQLGRRVHGGDGLGRKMCFFPG